MSVCACRGSVGERISDVAVSAICFARSSKSDCRDLVIGGFGGPSPRSAWASSSARVEMRCVRCSLGSSRASDLAQGRSKVERRRRSSVLVRAPAASPAGADSELPQDAVRGSTPPVDPEKGIFAEPPNRRPVRIRPLLFVLDEGRNGAPNGVGASAPSPCSATKRSTVVHDSLSRTLNRIAMPGLLSVRTLTTTPSPRSARSPFESSSSKRTGVPGGLGVRVRKNRPAEDTFSAYRLANSSTSL